MAKKKFNAKGVVKSLLVVGGTGALVQVASTMIEGAVDATTGKPANADMVNYGLIALGLVLPEVVKNDVVATASGAALAIGAYRLSESYKVAEKLGINGIGAATDYRAVIGQDWTPDKAMKTEKANEVQPSNVI
jgi:hypothetical protein